MTFFFNERKPKAKAHLWTGSDTVCRMWTTGGMKQSRPGWVTAPTDQGRELCHMCAVNAGQEEPQQPVPAQGP